MIQWRVNKKPRHFEIWLVAIASSMLASSSSSDAMIVKFYVIGALLASSNASFRRHFISDTKEQQFFPRLGCKPKRCRRFEKGNP